MRAVIILCFVSITSSNEIYENANIKLNQQNTTTLYPIKSVPLDLKDEKPQVNNNETSNEGTETRDVPKIQRCDHGNQLREEINTANSEKDITISSEASGEVENEVSSDNEHEMKTESKESTTWKINATYAPSSVSDASDKTEDGFKDFKPSPHLGNFYDEGSFISPPQTNKESFIPYTPPSLTSFDKEFYRLNYKTPSDSYQSPIENPYGFENMKFTSGLEPRPTVESTFEIPAGGLYNLPDAFQEKPSSDSDSTDFGLQFKEQKDTSVKKRVNPWKSVLHLVTSLLPIGLIVSALTPNLITLENADNNPGFSSRISRRSEDVSSLPNISDSCKRRLLCEIHSTHYYMSDPTYVQRRPCYKVRCEDPRSMGRLLRWLLDRNRSGYQPGDHDRRGYIIT